MIKVIQITPDNMKDVEESLHFIVKNALTD